MFGLERAKRKSEQQLKRDKAGFDKMYKQFKDLMKAIDKNIKDVVKEGDEIRALKKDVDSGPSKYQLLKKQVDAEKKLLESEKDAVKELGI